MASEGTTTTTPTPSSSSSSSPSIPTQPIPNPAVATTPEDDAIPILSLHSTDSASTLRPSPPASPPPSAEDRRQTLTCSLCLDIYRNPKLLPCSHTFCHHCLERLLSHFRTSSAFPCPNCRRRVPMPTHGVGAFQTNFYLLPEDLVRAREGTCCLGHPEQELDLFCVDCQTPVCLKCKVTRHENHKTQELTDACYAAREQLKEEKERLQQAVTAMLQQVETARKEQQAQLDKRSSLENIIRKQHGTLVAAAEKFLVEALATLKTASEGVEANLHEQVLTKKSDLEELCSLQDEMGKIFNTENRYKLLAAIKEMKQGRGSPQALNTIISGNQEVLRSDLQPDFILSHFRQFQSTATSVDAELKTCSELCFQEGVFKVRHIRTSVSVEKQFKCGKRPDSKAFCICPLDDGNVWVSYIRNGLRDPPPAEKYDSNGTLLCTSEKMVGKVSFKSIGNGKIRYLLPFEGGPRMYCKFGSKMHFKLNTSVDGRATITKVEVIREEPFNARLSEEITIKVGPHRAFDVDCDENFFAVVEQPVPPETKRKVKMFKRKEEDPIALYTPPTPTFQPSDVNFCRLGGDPAMLVADELGDSIHVLSVKEDGGLRFLRYLAPGCPSLLGPTALNVDTEGRLWVACRGGQLLTMFPVC